MAAAKKRGLGRGLDALLGAQQIVEQSHQDIEQVQQTDNNSLRTVPVDLIQRGRYQPRRVIDDAGIEELAESIRVQGLMQPIVIRSIGGERYEIIAGERRWRACQKAGLSEIPALIKDVPDESAIAMSLIENIQRENLNPMEEAMALHRLKQEFELTHEQTAAAVGKSRSAVSNLLRLVNLPDKVRTLLENGDMEMGHARALLALDTADQLPAAVEIIENELSVRQAEALVKSLLNRGSPKTQDSESKKAAKPADVQSLERDLSERLGAPVNIKPGKKGRGQLVISYASLDILDGILKHIK